jgi:hypothetical protein
MPEEEEVEEEEEGEEKKVEKSGGCPPIAVRAFPEFFSNLRTLFPFGHTNHMTSILLSI